MKLLILAIFISLLGGCESSPKPYPKEIISHIQEFQNMTGIELDRRHNEIVFRPLDEGIFYFLFEVIGRQEVWGFCNILTGTVYIDRNVWGRLGYLGKEELLFHELGHCYFGILFHTTGNLTDGCPDSIMHEEMAWGRCYKKHRDLYFKKLLNEKN